MSDIEKPNTEHSAVILGTSWPLQSESEWARFAANLKATSGRLWAEFCGNQHDIKNDVYGQEGEFIQAARKLITRRENTLFNRVKAYELAHQRADSMSHTMRATKEDLEQIVYDTEKQVTQKRQEAQTARTQARAAALGNETLARPTIDAIDAKLEAEENTIIGGAKALAMGSDATAAASASRYVAAIQEWKPPNPVDGETAPATPLSTGTGSSAAPVAPLSPGIQAVNYNTFKPKISQLG